MPKLKYTALKKIVDDKVSYAVADILWEVVPRLLINEALDLEQALWVAIDQRILSCIEGMPL